MTKGGRKKGGSFMTVSYMHRVMCLLSQHVYLCTSVRVLVTIIATCFAADLFLLTCILLSEVCVWKHIKSLQ